VVVVEDGRMKLALRVITYITYITTFKRRITPDFEADGRMEGDGRIE
jgi:hypothetical protein